MVSYERRTCNARARYFPHQRLGSWRCPELLINTLTRQPGCYWRCRGAFWGGEYWSDQPAGGVDRLAVVRTAADSDATGQKDSLVILTFGAELLAKQLL